MLKNYVVIIENVEVDRQNSMINYLISENHSNHKSTKILCDEDSAAYKINLTKKYHFNELNYISNKKGGRPLKRIAKSVTFNIPKDFEQSEKDILEVKSQLVNSLVQYFKSMNIDLNIDDLFMPIHLQDNNHINLIIPTLDNKGQNIREFNTPSFLTKIKLDFTLIVDKVLNQNIDNYKVPTKEEREHNQVLKSYRAMLVRYEAEILEIKSLDDNLSQKRLKYVNKMIVNLSRLVKGNDKLRLDKIEKINEDNDKYNKSNNTNIKKISIKR